MLRFLLAVPEMGTLRRRGLATRSCHFARSIDDGPAPVSLLRRPSVGVIANSRDARDGVLVCPPIAVWWRRVVPTGSGSPSNGKHAANRRLRAARPGRVCAAEFGRQAAWRTPRPRSPRASSVAAAARYIAASPAPRCVHRASRAACPGGLIWVHQTQYAMAVMLRCRGDH
jgi:hypothetical protein